MKDLNFYEKLIKAKGEMGAIKKSATNPFFKSKYADLTTILEVVEPALLSNGLLLIQPIKDGKVFSIITDGDVSIESSIDLGTFNKPQDLGSAITYYRRYTLQSLLGLSAEDDDGNSANKGASVNLAKSQATKQKPVDINACIDKLTASKTLKELASVWNSLSRNEKAQTEVLAKKDELKELLK